MEYKAVDQLRSVADVHAKGHKCMSRRERLERWATLLERDPSRRLRSLGEIEYKAPAERQAMRADNSPLTVAFEDPVLREEGLASDRLGDAIHFFELTEGQAHRLLCSCMNGATIAADRAARRIRAIANPDHRIRAAFYVAAGALAAAPVVMYMLG